MFLDNKYTKWYYRIIDRARSRKIIGYNEVHHIVPRCIGGSNLNDNLVELTAREHLIVHRLLIRMTVGNLHYKMIHALFAMSTLRNARHNRTTLNSRSYERLKKQYSLVMSVRQVGANNRFFGKQHSQETKLKISTARKGTKASQETKDKMSSTRKGLLVGDKNGMYGKHHTKETKEKISAKVSGKNNGFFGKHHSEVQRERKRIEKLNQPKLECPYCKKVVDNMNYRRWHGDRCKEK